jgi:hypothetical protein
MWVVFLIAGAGFFLQLSTYFGIAQSISASIFRITFDFPFSTWLIFSIQCQGLVDFLRKMVGCMEIL